MKWKYFGAACVFAGYVVHALGAPAFAIVIGIAMAIAWNGWKNRERRAYEKN
jgi:biotin transporter BioY